MSFVTKVNLVLNRTLAALRKTAEQQIKLANQRAARKIVMARTRTERLRARAQADREKARIYRELKEAQDAARDAAVAVKKARMEAGDLTTSEQMERFGRTTARSVWSLADRFVRPPPKRRVTKRRTTGRRTASHRR